MFRQCETLSLAEQKTNPDIRLLVDQVAKQMALFKKLIQTIITDPALKARGYLLLATITQTSGPTIFLSATKILNSTEAGYYCNEARNEIEKLSDTANFKKFDLLVNLLDLKKEHWHYFTLRMKNNALDLMKNKAPNLVKKTRNLKHINNARKHIDNVENLDLLKNQYMPYLKLTQDMPLREDVPFLPFLRKHTTLIQKLLEAVSYNESMSSFSWELTCYDDDIKQIRKLSTDLMDLVENDIDNLLPSYPFYVIFKGAAALKDPIEKQQLFNLLGDKDSKWYKLKMILEWKEKFLTVRLINEPHLSERLSDVQDKLRNMAMTETIFNKLAEAEFLNQLKIELKAEKNFKSSYIQDRAKQFELKKNSIEEEKESASEETIPTAPLEISLLDEASKLFLAGEFEQAIALCKKFRASDACKNALNIIKCQMVLGDCYEARARAQYFSGKNELSFESGSLAIQAYKEGRETAEAYLKSLSPHSAAYSNVDAYREILTDLENQFYDAAQFDEKEETPVETAKAEKSLTTSTFAPKLKSNKSNKKAVPEEKKVLTPNEEIKFSKKKYPFTISLPKEVDQVFQLLSENANQVFLVGGAVWNAIRGKQPKDYDLLVNLPLEQIMAILNNLKENSSCPIFIKQCGKAHPIIQVEINRQKIEISPFHSLAAQLPVKIAFQDPLVEDVIQRGVKRDALLYRYNYKKKEGYILDFVGGYEDVLNDEITPILTKDILHQDPVKTLRMIKSKAQYSLKMDDALINPQVIKKLDRGTLAYQVSRLFFSGHAAASYKELVYYNVFPLIFPRAQTHLSNQEYSCLLENLFASMDKTCKTGQLFSTANFFAVLLWQELLKRLRDPKKRYNLADQAFFDSTVHDLIQEQHQITFITFDIQKQITAIWHNYVAENRSFFELNIPPVGVSYENRKSVNYLSSMLSVANAQADLSISSQIIASPTGPGLFNQASTGGPQQPDRQRIQSPRV